MLLARLERLARPDEDLVGHDRRRREELGAAHGDAGRVLVDDARDHVLGAVALVAEGL